MTQAVPTVEALLDRLALDWPEWYVFDVQQRPPSGASHKWYWDNRPWSVRLQHSQGGLLTRGRGATLADALAEVLVSLRLVEAGRANAQREPFRPALNPDTASL